MMPMVFHNSGVIALIHTEWDTNLINSEILSFVRQTSSNLKIFVASMMVMMLIWTLRLVIGLQILMFTTSVFF